MTMDRAARKAFHTQRLNALNRGIAWELTLEEWWAVWMESGKWEQRGRRKGNYVMSRPGDTGPYAVWNVSIVTNQQNGREARTHAQARDGVYLLLPGTKKPWNARFRNRSLGYFYTEEEARAARKTAVDAHVAAAGRLRGGWTLSDETKAKISAGRRAVVARKQREREALGL